MLILTNKDFNLQLNFFWEIFSWFIKRIYRFKHLYYLLVYTSWLHHLLVYTTLKLLNKQHPIIIFTFNSRRKESKTINRLQAIACWKLDWAIENRYLAKMMWPAKLVTTVWRLFKEICFPYLVNTAPAYINIHNFFNMTPSRNS